MDYGKDADSINAQDPTSTPGFNSKMEAQGQDLDDFIVQDEPGTMVPVLILPPLPPLPESANLTPIECKQTTHTSELEEATARPHAAVD